MLKKGWKFSIITEKIKIEVGVIIDIGGHDLEMVSYWFIKYMLKLGRSKQLPGSFDYFDLIHINLHKLA